MMMGSVPKAAFWAPRGPRDRANKIKAAKAAVVLALSMLTSSKRGYI
jgi:hypothetical protein